MTIPNLAHFVFGLREQSEPFHLVHYLCLESCRRILEPDEIFFHCKHLPYGEHWDAIEPHLTLVDVDFAPEVLDATYDEALVPSRYRYAHHADFVRLDALIEYGGVYADIDTLFVQPFPTEWFGQPFVIGWEDAVRDERTGEVRPSLCNAMLLSQVGGEFASKWRGEMGAALNGTWSNHSNFLSHELSVRMPEQVHVVPRRAFFHHGPSREGVAGLFERCEADTEGIFSLHLWSHLWWEEQRRDFTDVHAGMLTEDYIRAVDTTYNVCAREFLAPEGSVPGTRASVVSSTRPRVHYLSLHEESGYGVAGRRCMRALDEAGADVCWRPFVPSHAWGLGYAPGDNSSISDAELGHLLADTGPPNAVVAHLTPEYYPQVRALYPGIPLVGHTVWETDRLPGHWPDLLDVADLLIVPCQWNAEIIRQSGISTPVHVVPHVVDLDAGSPVDGWPELEPGTFLFYTIASWTARKAVWNTVRAYQLAFTRDDPVRLLIKTEERDHTVTELAPTAGAREGTTSWALARLLREFRHPASMELVTRRLSSDEIRALHERGDCFVSLCRSEGWGLSAFDAAALGTPIVITGFGGHLDYLDSSTAFLVDHDIVPVDDRAGAGSYTLDQTWAEPSLEHAARLLRQAVDDPPATLARADAARRRVRNRYTPARVAAELLSALESVVPAS